MTKTSGFANLGLDDRLVETLADLGYEEPTPIQRESIPALVEGRSLLGQAATGTGKTAAFALPMLHRIQGKRGKSKAPRGLVLVPTRELAMQVAEAVHRYGRSLGIAVLPIYGGQSYDQQLRALHRGVDVVVATPGRALDHLRNRTLDLKQVETVVLDEADEMLDMGFLDDIEAILAETPPERQTVLFSATMAQRVASVAKRHLSDPVKVRIVPEPLAKGEMPAVRQLVYIVPRAHKVAALGRIMDIENPASAIVFCRTRTEVDELSLKLSAQGHRVEPLHGGMSQQQRDRVMKKLRGASADLVIATDVAARGLDIDRLTHVINFDVPAAPEAYVHRIGRVGRAGREGVAITIAEPRERRMLRNIEMATRMRLELANLPTLADLQARRLELTRAALREVLLEGGLDKFQDVVDTLAEEFELRDVALAAVKLVHKAEGGDQETEELPSFAQQAPRNDVPMVRIYVGAGRHAGIRPQDLVGAITNEAGINGRDIGAIQIADRFSLVELREDVVETVVQALSAATIKGQKVTVRPDKEPNRAAPEPRGGQGFKPPFKGKKPHRKGQGGPRR